MVSGGADGPWLLEMAKENEVPHVTGSQMGTKIGSFPMEIQHHAGVKR